MRPVLTPSARRLWRDSSTLQLGRDGRATVLAGIDEGVRATLALLDGTRDRDQLVLDAADVGCPAGGGERAAGSPIGSDITRKSAWYMAREVVTRSAWWASNASSGTMCSALHGPARRVGAPGDSGHVESPQVSPITDR